MNAAQAKRIPLTTILARLGHTSSHQSGDDVWYPSPFRDEAEPSFKVNEKDNVWYDFGAGEGGNVLDFIMHLRRHRDISRALEELEEIVGRSQLKRDTNTRDLFTASPESSTSTNSPPAFAIRHTQHLQNRALIQYLASRGISKDIASLYVNEVYYTHKGKPYFALGFANESSGYELRNPYFKGVIGNKDITLLRTDENATRTVMVFEGFMDFLSYLTFYELKIPETTVLVLNSVAMKDRAVETIKALGADTVDLYLDHDNAGQALTRHFQEALPHMTVTDQSNVYAGYKDFNAFLVTSEQQRRASTGRA